MKTRNNLIKVRLTEDEAERIKSYADICGLTQSALTRMIIMGRRSKPKPPESFWMMLNEIYSIHNSFKVIADSGASGSEIAREHQKETADFILQLQAAVTLPERIRYGDNKNSGD